jgi:hypothetical protein
MRRSVPAAAGPLRNFVAAVVLAEKGWQAGCRSRSGSSFRLPAEYVKELQDVIKTSTL